MTVRIVELQKGGPMPDNELTTVQIDTETREKLRELSAANERSMAAQIRWMVQRDYAQCKLQIPLPMPTESAPVQS